MGSECGVLVSDGAAARSGMQWLVGKATQTRVQEAKRWVKGRMLVRKAVLEHGYRSR